MGILCIVWIVGAVFLLTALLCGGIVFLVMRSARERNRGWAQVAAVLGLEHQRNHVGGVLDGQQVRLTPVVSGSGRNQSIQTVALASFDPPLGVGLSVRPEGFLDTMSGALLGLRDLHTGDAAFDARFQVGAREDERALAILDSNVRRECLEVTGDWKLTMDDTAVRLTRAGNTSNEAWITEALRTVARIARIVNEGRQRAQSPTTHAESAS